VTALRIVSTGMVVLVTALIGLWLSAESRAQAPAPEPAGSIVGAWTLNKDLSDRPQDREPDREGRPGGRRSGGFGRGGGGFGRGGFGRGGGGDRGGGATSPEDVARMRNAMRDIMNPPDRLTITQTERMVIMTTGDGRTTRLSTDGKTIKDDSTRIERKTKWDGGKLVSEISHLGPGKITETYSADPEHHQLHVTVQVENARQPMTVNRIYDAEER
jgi:hypothetical protein